MRVYHAPTGTMAARSATRSGAARETQGRCSVALVERHRAPRCGGTPNRGENDSEPQAFGAPGWLCAEQTELADLPEPGPRSSGAILGGSAAWAPRPLEPVRVTSR